MQDRRCSLLNALIKYVTAVSCADVKKELLAFLRRSVPMQFVRIVISSEIIAKALMRGLPATDLGHTFLGDNNYKYLV